MLLKASSIITAFKMKNAAGGNDTRQNTTLQDILRKLLKLEFLMSSVKGRANKQAGTSSNAPISAVAKLTTDMRSKPMKAAEIVTDFKISHSGFGGEPMMRYKIRSPTVEIENQMMELAAGLQSGILQMK